MTIDDILDNALHTVLQCNDWDSADAMQYCNELQNLSTACTELIEYTDTKFFSTFRYLEL